jgi:hypothetical protein
MVLGLFIAFGTAMLCGHGGCSWLYWFVAGFEPSIG